ncbi:MAG: metallophosphoesterase [Myxococcales bacterium]|nr:metallophosphoesterase [Myxococcales bacterium]HIK84797.1 metallophosphoesterase [Myxococcales bacterium]
MRIGVVSDTHDRMPNVERIVNLFNQIRVDRVIHTGDLTQPAVLEALAQLDAPVYGVFGNNDIPDHARLAADATRLGLNFGLPPRTLDWAGRRILVLHDPEDTLDVSPDPVDLILHGHTHRHRHEQIGNTLIFNPGECAGFLKGRNAVGVIDLISLKAERVLF